MESELGGRILLELEQWSELVEKQRSIQAVALSDDDSLDVEPVLRSPRERFEHHQVFGRASDHHGVTGELRGGRPVDEPRLERQPSHRDVDRHAIESLDEHHAVFERKLARVRNPRGVSCKDRVDEALFATKTCK